MEMYLIKKNSMWMSTSQWSAAPMLVFLGRCFGIIQSKFLLCTALYESVHPQSLAPVHKLFHKNNPKSGETKKDGKKLLIKLPGDRPWYWVKSLFFAEMGNIRLYPFVWSNK